ncbi:MAG: DUF59 domain-containing protein [Pseudomonadota bacterium]
MMTKNKIDIKEDQPSNQSDPNQGELEIGMGNYPYPYGYQHDHQFIDGADEPIEEAVPEGFEAFSGESLKQEQTPASRDDVEAALREVYDPEIPVNIYDLGLIYDIRIEPQGDIFISMTLTAPACPVAGELPQEVADQVASLENAGRVCVQITWQPAWNPSMMSEEARMALDFF